MAVPLARGDAALGALVDTGSFALHCTPAINLFPRHADRIHVTDQQAEHHVVVDRTRPMDFEVYSVQRVVGYGEGVEAEQEFRPFYASVDADARAPGGATSRCGASRARSRRRSAATARGPATSAARCFLSLVDPREAPYSGRIRQLAVEVLVTNRDLPLLMPVGQRRRLQPGRLRARGGHALPARPQSAPLRRSPRARWRGG